MKRERFHLGTLAFYAALCLRYDIIGALLPRALDERVQQLLADLDDLSEVIMKTADDGWHQGYNDGWRYARDLG